MNKNTSTIRIWKESPLPPPSPPDQNQAQNQDESGGGILDSGDNISTQQQIPPPENAQNHAQKIESGDSGDSGGIIPPLEEENSMLIAAIMKIFSQKDMLRLILSGRKELLSLLIFAAAFVDSNGNTRYYIYQIILNY